MKIELECTYCGKKWEATVYNKQMIEAMSCSKCGDSNLKVRDLAVAKIDTYSTKENAVSKVDYYQGCPPFPEKKRTQDWGEMYDDYAPGVD
jgi:transcription elongation factor Elf1